MLWKGLEGRGEAFGSPTSVIQEFIRCRFERFDAEGLDCQFVVEVDRQHLPDAGQGFVLLFEVVAVEAVGELEADRQGEQQKDAEQAVKPAARQAGHEQGGRGQTSDHAGTS